MNAQYQRLWLLAACLTPLTLTAQPTSAPASPPDLPDLADIDIGADEVFMDIPDPGQGGGVARDEDTIDIDFPDQDVREIILNVATLYELNVVVPDDLVGRVSIKLKDVTWEQVFKVVLDQVDYTYRVEDNIIKIMSQEEEALEPLETQIFVVNFQPAQELSSSVGAVIDASYGGKIQVAQRANALLVTERPSKMPRIQEIIDRLDQPTAQVMIESKFVELTNRDAEAEGIDWSFLGGYTAGVSEISREYDNLETRTRQNQNSSDSNTSVPLTGTPTGTATQTALNELTRGGTLSRADTAVFSADALQLIFNALESDSEVEIISNPTVVTINNREAEILVGEEFPIVSPRFNSETGSYEAGEAEEKQFGVRLVVTPSVNQAGFITLEVEPEVSNLAGTVAQFGAEYPIVATRRTKSVVTIRNGYTLALGGLMERNDSRNQTRVPVLGRIPMVGRLFQNESDSGNVRNLVIFITARVLSATGATYRDVFSQRRLWEMGVNDRDLPGYEPPPTEAALFEALQEQQDDLEQLSAENRLRLQLEALRKQQNKALEDYEPEIERDSNVSRRNQ